MNAEKMRSNIARVSELSLKYIGLTGEDIERLHSMAEKVLSKKDEIISGVMSSLTSDPDAVEVIRKTGLEAERAIKLFELWLTKVFKDQYDEKHALSVFRIGLAHVKSGVDERLMINNMGAFTREILKHINNVEDALVVSKALFWNLSIMIYSYEYVKNLVIEEAIGTSEELMKRLISLFSERVYKELLELL